MHQLHPTAGFAFVLSRTAFDHGISHKYGFPEEQEDFDSKYFDSTVDFWIRYWENLPLKRKVTIFLHALVRSLVQGKKYQDCFEFNLKIAEKEGTLFRPDPAPSQARIDERFTDIGDWEAEITGKITKEELDSYSVFLEFIKTLNIFGQEPDEIG